MTSEPEVTSEDKLQSEPGTRDNQRDVRRVNSFCYIVNVRGGRKRKGRRRKGRREKRKEEGERCPGLTCLVLRRGGRPGRKEPHPVVGFSSVSPPRPASSPALSPCIYTHTLTLC